MHAPTLAVFTICSNNYVPMARLLIESARRHHPDAACYLCLADRRHEDPDFYPAGCEIVSAEDLDIPDFPSFAFRYDIMELNTALKPFMMRRLLARGHRFVLYFDPDIEIFRPLTPVTDALSDDGSFALTPHICHPNEGTAFPDDLGIMQAGIYNLGFLGVAASHEADRLLSWWSRRLLFQCVNDQPNGVFVDQKFMDLLPGFGDGVRILRDPTMNVAYWNLPHRAVGRSEGRWTVDGRPLTFFHFSGLDPHDTTRLSKYTDAFRGDLQPDLAALVDDYAARLRAGGHRAQPAPEYAWARFASGTPIPDVVRRIFREDHEVWPGTPAEDYEAYLHTATSEPWVGPYAGHVTGLMAKLRHRHPWLRGRFLPARPEDARDYARWFLDHGETLGIDARLVEPVAERVGAAHLPDRAPPPSVDADAPAIDVVGYLRLALGLGEAGRLTLRALHRAGYRVGAIPTALNSNSPSVDDSTEPFVRADGRAPVQIFSINADQIGQVRADLADRLRPDAYRIMIKFWELSALPDAWIPAFDLVDEIWAPTRFVQHTLLKRLQKPVIRMPLMLDFVPPPAAPRAAFGLPDDTFLFFFAFDYFSSPERKNPLAVYEAFRRAFRGPSAPRGRKVALVLKTLNVDKAPPEKKALLDGLRADDDVILIERTLSREDTHTLVAMCDAVVSLHRSEGLGLLVAEAMVLGKPVVSTDYSATTELVTPSTGYPVNHRLVPVQAGEYPFHEGQVWADADVDHAAWQMRMVASGGPDRDLRVARARALIRDQYGEAAVTARQRDRLAAIGVRA